MDYVPKRDLSGILVWAHQESKKVWIGNHGYFTGYRRLCQKQIWKTDYLQLCITNIIETIYHIDQSIEWITRTFRSWAEKTCLIWYRRMIDFCRQSTCSRQNISITGRERIYHDRYTNDEIKIGTRNKIKGTSKQNLVPFPTYHVSIVNLAFII